MNIMAIEITLTSTLTTTEKGTVKLDLHTDGTQDVTSKIFAIEVLPRSADKLAPIYRFSHICSPAELTEFPDDQPGCSCYFRVDDITLIFDTPVHANLVLETVKGDIKKLVSELRALEANEGVIDTTTF